MQDLDFTKHQICLMVGSCGSGKSNALKYWILKNSTGKNPVFNFGIAFTGSKFDGEYSGDTGYLPDDNVYEGYDEEVLERYVAALEKMKEEDDEVPINFLILDDLLGILSKFDGRLLNFFANSRHYNCRIFLTSQNLVTNAASAIREVTTAALMFPSRNFLTQENLFRNFGGLFPNFDEFRAHMNDVLTEPYTGLLYKERVAHLEDNYSLFKAPDMTDFEIKLDY